MHSANINTKVEEIEELRGANVAPLFVLKIASRINLYWYICNRILAMNKVFLLLTFCALVCSSCGSDGTEDGIVENGFVQFFEGNGFSACGYVLELGNGTEFRVVLPQNLPGSYQVDGLPVQVNYQNLGSWITCELGVTTADLEEVYVNDIQTR